jgi:16S rRNA (guanine966-N2)-methyltransferase
MSRARGPAAGSGDVRIVGGRLRGSKIAVRDRPGLRPSPDRVRETLFNWLMPVIDGARCLDLYAGTGVLGLEAASRGAREVVLVEADRAQAAAIEVDRLRLHVDVARVVAGRAEDFLAGVPTAFDVVFVDPPFALDAWSACLARLAAGWLARGARVYVESPSGASYAVPAGWRLHREGRAGDVAFRLYVVDDGTRHASSPAED